MNAKISLFATRFTSKIRAIHDKPPRTLTSILRTVAGCTLCLLFLACAFSFARADVVIPRSLATTEGNTSESLAGLFGSNAYTNQIQVAGSELSALGLQPGDLITGLRQRLDGGLTTGPAASIAISDFEITLAQAANAISTMSTVYNVNMISPVMVRDGSYTLAANSMPGGGSPNPFGALVPFDTPYTYQGGDLIVMISRTSASPGVAIDSSASYTGQNTLYRILLNGNTFHAATGILQGAMGVFQLQTVPEPASVGMLMVAGTIVAASFRRRVKPPVPSS